MNIVFMGTPEFSVPCIDRIIKDNHNISAVFTQTDKPKGRGNIITASPVKEAAMKNGLEVFQPVSLKDENITELLLKIAPDLIIVVAYGKILPKTILNIPVYGCVNIHASLLPKYRGSAPIQWSLINGEHITGITSIYMDEGVDTGDILLSETIDIDNNENAGSLFERLSKIGAEVLSNTITSIINKTIIPVKQDGSLSTYAPILRKTICRVDWNEPAMNVHNLIRGLAPFLYATTVVDGKLIKIISSEVCEFGNGAAGEVVDSSEKLIIACGNNTAIELKSLQAQGKRAMPAKEFLRGNKISVHTILA